MDKVIYKELTIDKKQSELGGVKNRSTELDYMKGILIILVVLGHIHTPLSCWIYQFHIPVFFMISGFLWNTKHSNDIDSMKHYIIGKLKRLYIPFVLLNVVFILLNNFFLRIGFITDDPNFLDLTRSYLIAQTTSQHMDCLSMITGIANALVFSAGYARLSGVTWFLSSLFMVCVGHLLWEYIITKLLKRNKIGRFVVLFFSLTLCLTFCIIIENYSIGLPGIIKRFFGCYAAYLCGVIFRELDIIKFCNPKSGVIAFIVTVVLFLIPVNTSVELSKNIIGNPFFFLVLCCSGFVFCIELARLLCSYKIKAFEICGKESMAIFLLHPISFKIVTYIYLLVFGRPMVLLAAYFALDGECLLLPLFYLLTGVFVPLACNRCYSDIKEKIKFL